MTALRHLSLGLVALLILLLGGAWLVPSFLDWDRYRDDVAELASAALGQRVRIEGAVRLQVLPQPLLLAEGVSIDVADRAEVTVARLHLRVALAPLLAGHVDARELVLRGADIRLPWPPPPAALTWRTPSWLSSLSARIEQGRLQVGDAVVTGLHATLATSDASGSFLAAGRAQGGGRDWTFTARISQPGGDGAVGLDLTLDGQGAVQGTGIVVAGQLQADGTLLGRIALRGPDLSQLAPAPPVPFRAEGRLTSGGGLVAADELAGDLAGAPVKGAIALRLLPRLRLDLALAASRLDLDAWGPALLHGAAGGLPRLPLGIDLSAEAAAWAGGTLRAVRAAFDIADGAVEVREARALLPGEADLRLKGALTQADQRLRFAGEATLEAPSLRTTLDWAAAAGFGPVDSLPAGVLRKASLKGRVAISNGEAMLSDVAGTVDDGAVLALLAWRPAPRPALRAVVTAERLDLDAWAPASWPGLSAAAGLLGPVSVDLRLQAEQALWHGAVLGPLSFDVEATPGRIALRRLEGEWAGASFTASGTLAEGGRLSEARAELRSERATGLAPLLEWALGAEATSRAAPLLRGAASLQLQASGAPETLGLRLTAALADLALEATPTLDLRTGRWSGALLARHPGAPRLAETLGLRGATAWLGDGSLALVAQLAGSPDRLVAEPFDLVAGGLRAGGTLRLDRGARPRLAGRIAADSLMLPLPYLRSPDPLALDALSGWEAELRVSARSVSLAREPVMEDAAATIALAGGRLRVEGLVARVGGGALEGMLDFDAAARPPALAVQAKLRDMRVAAPVFDLPLDLAGGTLDATLRLSAAGFSPSGLLASLAGDVAVTGRQGVVAGIDLARAGPALADADLRAALAGGVTSFETLALDATLDRGGVTIARAALQGESGRIAASGTIDLTRALLSLRLALIPAVADPPEIGLRIDGPADSPQRVPELADAVRWRALRP